MSDTGMTYIEWLASQGIKATRYTVGDVTPNDHTHDLYLRDDVPIATTTNQTGTGLKGYHAHSITVDENGDLVCGPAGPDNHAHDKFTVVADES